MTHNLFHAGLIFASMELPSKLLEKTVSYFESLPGVGRRTALRYTLQLLKLSQDEAKNFGQSIIQLAEDLRFCSVCHNVSDAEVCSICAHPKRDQSIICVVEDLRDLLAIEATAQFYGVYHVLGGLISPLDGVGPKDLHIDSLVARCAAESCKEIIFALPATMEGDTTSFYLYKRVQQYAISVTSLARGVAFGNEIQYTDELTLGRSLLARLPYEGSLKST